MLIRRDDSSGKSANNRVNMPARCCSIVSLPVASSAKGMGSKTSKCGAMNFGVDTHGVLYIKRSSTGRGKPGPEICVSLNLSSRDSDFVLNNVETINACIAPDTPRGIDGRCFAKLNVRRHIRIQNHIV